MMRGSEGEGNCGPGSALDFWGKGPRFESGIYYKDPDALQDHCVIMKKISLQRGKSTPEAKKI